MLATKLNYDYEFHLLLLQNTQTVYYETAPHLPQKQIGVPVIARLLHMLLLSPPIDLCGHISKLIKS